MLGDDEAFDLILVDLNMPGIDGIAFLTALANRELDIPATIISAVEDVAVIHSALALGALGFISKSMTAIEIHAAISQVLEGEVFIPHKLQAALARLSSKRKTDSVAGLTKRQLEVLQLMNKGHTNQQIADTLFISENTAKFHVRALFDTFGASNRTQCLVKAKQQGLLSE